MWLLTLLEQITGFLPRPIIIPPDEGGFRQTPKPWNGWPWNNWPWVRLEWIKNPCSCKPWIPKHKNLTSTWITEMKPGEWYWIIPWFSEYATIKTKTQPKDIRAQSVWTKDGIDVTVGTAVIYSIRNPLKALLNVLDSDDSIQTIVLSVVNNFIQKYTLDELKSEKIKALENEILQVVKEESQGWGLNIQSVTITDIGKAINYRLLLSGLEKFNK